MKDRDFLWCLVHGLLDREEELEQLCPDCRTHTREARCPVCGQPRGTWGEGGVNGGFDEAEFEKRRGGMSGD